LSLPMVAECVSKLTAQRSALPLLKTLQGEVYAWGYSTGELKGAVFEDVEVLLKLCQGKNILAATYSSGSVNAQKLLFSHAQSVSSSGKAHAAEVVDLTPLISEYFDGTVGSKIDSSSYRTIAELLESNAKDYPRKIDNGAKIWFISDSEAEVDACNASGRMTGILIDRNLGQSGSMHDVIGNFQPIITALHQA